EVAGNAGFGGAIFVAERPIPPVRPASGNGDITLTNVHFSSNSALQSGGAIFIAGSGCCRRVTITDSTFFNNGSTSSGGGIYWDNSHWCDTPPGCRTLSQRPLIINTANFEANHATNEGGGLWTFIWFARPPVCHIGIPELPAPVQPAGCRRFVNQGTLPVLSYFSVNPTGNTVNRGVYFLKNVAGNSGSSYFCTVAPPECPGP